MTLPGAHPGRVMGAWAVTGSKVMDEQSQSEEKVRLFLTVAGFQRRPAEGCGWEGAGST